ncbi:MAG: uracil-DNA glycosylase [Campylobacterota bacterium]|nr:uracil-DNA glycosylase [Campylobacterota bacterium]
MNWQDIINDEKKQDYFKKLDKFLDIEYSTNTIYPNRDKIFTAFELTKYDNLKVVIIGQDPYHNPNQAQGLAFSTPKDIKNPPSVVNIFKEILSDTKKDSVNLDGDLTSWAEQGVLLINTILTVEKNKPKSHHKIGWEIFTKHILNHINDNFKDIIFILWGTPAIKMGSLIDKSKHHILTAPHPSPLSSYRGFFGSKHFSKTNDILKRVGKKEIVW